jgi:hypothetical protein
LWEPQSIDVLEIKLLVVHGTKTVTNLDMVGVLVTTSMPLGQSGSITLTGQSHLSSISITVPLDLEPAVMESHLSARHGIAQYRMQHSPQFEVRRLLIASLFALRV